MKQYLISEEDLGKLEVVFEEVRRDLGGNAAITLLDVRNRIKADPVTYSRALNLLNLIRTQEKEPA